MEHLSVSTEGTATHSVNTCKPDGECPLFQKSFVHLVVLCFEIRMYYCFPVFTFLLVQAKACGCSSQSCLMIQPWIVSCYHCSNKVHLHDLHFYSTFPVYWPLKVLYNTCQLHPFTHTHKHTFTHWWWRLPCNMPTAHQGQFGVPYLAQGYFHMQQRGIWTSDLLRQDQ